MTRQLVAILFGKITLLVSKLLSLGAGGTWPGEVGLAVYPQLISRFSIQFKHGIIIVAGTNGKTTTSLMINQILHQAGFKTIHNATGANLLNGIASALIKNSNPVGRIKADYGVFEVDENSLPLLVSNLKLKTLDVNIILVLLNLFRDQLDRYGEVDVIAEKWNSALQYLPLNSNIILNADDPLIAHLGTVVKSRESRKIVYFGINDPKQFIRKLEHATDSIFCLNCGGRLNYSGIYFSHLGIWKCGNCDEKRPQPDIFDFTSPLPGLYNQYNTLAAVSVGKALNIDEKKILQALQNFTPAFGRQEEFKVDAKRVKIFLSKNPAGFNTSLRTVLELKPNALLIMLNDQIPDGRDVSWIWDVDFETIPENIKVVVSGDRTYDMALRIKYAMKQWDNGTIKKLIIEPKIKQAVKKGLDEINQGQTLFILPTYSAMLEVRKILSGQKIL